jgi:acetylornithine deacetylase
MMWNGHIDTVGVAGMPEPFSGRIAGGRLFGRGAYDMKASIAAAMIALEDLARHPARGDVVLTAVADEEYASAGTEEVLRHVRTDGGICLEPTSLRTICAHKGFVWIEVRMEGRAAHGSRFELGIDANLKMGRLLGRLAAFEEELRARPPHPLLGPPSLHAATIHGGSGWSTYASECVLQIERRTVPGETVDETRREIETLGADSVRIVFAREPFEVSPGAAIVKSVQGAGGGEIAGDTPWMDASLMAAAGIETVILGPHGGGAHAAEEWADLESAGRLAEILRDAAYAYCGH